MKYFSNIALFDVLCSKFSEHVCTLDLICVSQHLFVYFRVLVALLNMPIWGHSEIPKNLTEEFQTLVHERIQTDARRWTDEQLATIKAKVKDPVVEEMGQFSEVVMTIMQALIPVYGFTEYFSRADLDYYKLASIAVESKVRFMVEIKVRYGFMVECNP